MRILIVEDDEVQAGLIRAELKRVFGNDSVEVISTESEFHSKIDKIRGNPPDVVVMDIMLRWADPSEQIPPRPKDVIREDRFRAGFRCNKMLAEDDRTKGIPVILFTVLDARDIAVELSGLPANVVHLPKDLMSPLVDLIVNRTAR